MLGNEIYPIRSNELDSDEAKITFMRRFLGDLIEKMCDLGDDNHGHRPKKGLPEPESDEDSA